MNIRTFSTSAATLALLLLAAFGALSAAQSGNAEPAASLNFSGTTYHLAAQSAPTPEYRKYEYLPAGQSFPHYQNMLLLERFATELAVAEVVNQQLALLNQRKQTDLVVQHHLIRNESSGEFLLDFILSGQTEDGTAIVEWNAYRYSPYQDAEGSQGVQLYAYSARGYGDEGGVAFLGDLKENRNTITQALATASLPQFEGDRR